MDVLRRLILNYEEFVERHPDIVTDLETTTKWVSYFVAGRISDSSLLVELINSLSNIVALYHDRIIERSNLKYSKEEEKCKTDFYDHLRIVLTVLEYSEIFIELSTKRLLGSKYKWFAVILLQTFKASARFMILKHSTIQNITSPALPALNRNLNSKKKLLQTPNSSSSTENSFHSLHTDTVRTDLTFKLKHSGRTVRKLHNADFSSNFVYDDRVAKHILLTAELVYISKPLVHLAAISMLGEKSWKQYFIAIIVDLLSIALQYHKRSYMTKEYKLEASRRCINLLLYIMRSPFYEHVTQHRLDQFLRYIYENVPILKAYVGSIRNYISKRQAIYFSLWAT